jgi:hypothetical protein
MGMTPTAYATNDPTVVAAFLAARDAESAFASHVIREAYALGNNTGVMRNGITSGQGYTTVGLAPKDEADPPAGWTYSSRKRMLVPARGRAGDAARQWLKDHQPPAEANVYGVLAAHGLPQNDLRGFKDGARLFSVPMVGHVDGTVWALYDGTPGVWYESEPREPSPPWEKRKLSEFYAAQEAAEAAAARDAADQPVRS